MHPGIQAFPRVVPAGRTVEFRVTAADGGTVFEPNRPYTARWFSKVDRTDDTRWEVRPDAGGAISCALRFAAAGEYAFEVRTQSGEEVLAAGRFFATSPGLSGLRPYKGDVHVHTNASDGKQTGISAARRARELGMDFLAITDHDKQEPSLQTANEVKLSGLALVVIPGEEVTIRENGGHILSLNAKGGASYLQKGGVYDAECARIVREEIRRRRLVPPLTEEQYARAVWAIRKIRELGGIALIAHPCWEGTTEKFYPPRALVWQLLKDGLCDGVELVGGSPSTEGNLLAVARHSEELERGRRWPVAGGSDAHQEDELGRLWTMVFAPALTPEEVVRAIVELRSVACDQRQGPDPVIFGPFDLVEYAYYLRREFFPRHDALCRLPSGSEGLASLYEQFWASC